MTHAFDQISYKLANKLVQQVAHYHQTSLGQIWQLVRKDGVRLPNGKIIYSKRDHGKNVYFQYQPRTSWS